MLSRTDPALLIKLFEQEVPEIYDGTVMIRGAVREAGDRAKVAVYSRERDVDPVGACVGMKGTRVQSIIRELRGEKIDIVEWSEDPIAVRDQRAQPGEGAARVDRRRCATGDGSRRRGQAAVAGHRQEGPERPAGGEADRLAIDIKSEEEKRREVEAQFEGARGRRSRSEASGRPKRRAAARRRAPGATSPARPTASRRRGWHGERRPRPAQAEQLPASAETADRRGFRRGEAAESERARRRAGEARELARYELR